MNRIISCLFLIVLALFALPVNAVAPMSTLDEPEESLQCTFPSFQLLLPNNAGTSESSVTSMTAGASVFVQATGAYIKCLTFKGQQAIASMNLAITRAVQGVLAPWQRKPNSQNASPR